MRQHLFEAARCLFGLVADTLQLLFCLSVTLNADLCYKLCAHHAHLFVPVPYLLSLGLTVQVIQSLELPPLRYVHEFPRLAVAIVRYLEAHPILWRLPIRAIGSDPASQRDPFKACI